MSYFPTDIPFMSDEEKRANGIESNLTDINVGNIEYIRKQDAVEAINTNADDLEQNGGIPFAQGARAMAIVVEQMLPADVVQVVRCKDCKYNATTHKCLNLDSFFFDTER